MQKRQTKASIAKPSKQQKKQQKKAVVRKSKRSMTSFAGVKQGTQEVFITGQVKRTANGKTTTTPLAVDFQATPSLATLAATQHRFMAGSALIDSFTEAFLVDAKGESAKVKAITVDPVIKEGTVKFTGPSFAWTKAQISSVTPDGTKFETTYDFGKDKVGFKLVATGKQSFTEEATLDVVEKAPFYDFIRTSKAAHEHLHVEEPAAAV